MGEREAGCSIEDDDFGLKVQREREREREKRGERNERELCLRRYRRSANIWETLNL